MALVCPRCGSPDTQVLVDKAQCLGCGGLFIQDGDTNTPADAGMDDSTRAVLERRLEPRRTVVGGNLADLQRAGAEAAVHGTGPLADVAVPTAPNAAPHPIATPAEVEAARGEVTRETVRVDGGQGPIQGDQVTATGTLTAAPPTEPVTEVVASDAGTGTERRK